MGSKNLKETFAVGAFMIVAMVLAALGGLYGLGLACAAGALSFIMLRGNMASVIGGVILVFAVDSALRFSFSFIFGLVVCMSALCINIAVRAHKGLLGVTAMGVCGIIIAAALCFAVAEMANIEGLKIADVRNGIDMINTQSVKILEDAGYFAQVTQEEKTLVINFMSMCTVPTMMIIICAVWAYIAVCVLKRIMRIVKSDLCNKIADFSEIRADKSCLIMLAVSLVVSSYTAEISPVIGAAATCMFLILLAFYVVCGISVLSFFVKNGKGMIRVVIAVALVLAILVMLPALIILGIIDSFKNMRKLGKENEEVER